jgi:hypothetical protein
LRIRSELLVIITFERKIVNNFLEVEKIRPGHSNGEDRHFLDSRVGGNDRK